MKAWVPEQKRNSSRSARAWLAVAIALVCAPEVWAQRSQLKPPWNMYSPQTDIQVGKQNAQMIERRVPLCNDPKIDAYLTNLGLMLAAKLPTRGVQYPLREQQRDQRICAARGLRVCESRSD